MKITRYRAIILALFSCAALLNAEEQQPESPSIWNRFVDTAKYYWGTFDKNLWQAVQNDNVAEAEAALAKGASPNNSSYRAFQSSPARGPQTTITARSSTVLNEAVKKNNSTLVQALLHKGANPNLQFVNDQLKREVALSNAPNAEIAKLLLDAGALVTLEKEPYDYPTKPLYLLGGLAPLTAAIKTNRSDVIKELLDAGAKAGIGSQLAQEAAEAHRADIVNTLQKSGVDTSTALPSGLPVGSYNDSCINCKVETTSGGKTLTCTCDYVRILPGEYDEQTGKYLEDAEAIYKNTSSVFISDNEEYKDIENQEGKLGLIK